MADDLMTLWRAVRSAGGRDAYVRAQLEEKGFLVRRRETDGMSKRELAKYKKELKAEAAERKRLAKEAWDAYKAAHIVHLGEGVYWNDAADFDRFDHPRAEERVAELGLPALDDPDALAEALGLGVAELRWLTYHRDAAKAIHYRRFTIPKSSGGERAIWAPLPKLKEAQRWVLREIVERLPVHGAAHGFVPGRSTATNAAAHADAEILVKVDLKDFFPTVTLPRVRGVFRQAGYREQVATLLALLCTESPREVVERGGETWYLALGPRCLPQGAPTSPALTNALSMRLDRRLTGLAKKLGWRYTRYADDLSFSLPVSKKKRKAAPNIGSLLGGVRIIVESEGFTVNEKKTQVAPPGARQKVTGLVINDGLGPRVPRADRRRIRAALHRLRLGKPLPEGESIERIEGWIAYIQMSQPELGERLAAELAEVRGG
ncbi:MAG: RNA-directed DNA polymerase [Alphaproteobacteria bacterium]|nr:RNA-directed DNA polymerase [Alphaproteobacteria bacterium]